MMNILLYLVCFLIFTFLQSLFINGVKELYNEGMLLYKFRLWIDNNVSNFSKKPLYNCIRCMSGLYSAITFFPFAIYLFGFRWEEIPVFFFNVGILIHLNFFIYKRQ